MHAAQDAVAAGLQRRMHVVGYARGFGHEAKKVVGEIHGFDRAEPEALEFGLRERPRTNGMMQNEQRLLQPSWILRLGRARSAGASITGAVSKSRRAKMSPTRIWL